MDGMWWLAIGFVVGANFGIVFMALLQLSASRRKEEARRQMAMYGTPLDRTSTVS